MQPRVARVGIPPKHFFHQIYDGGTQYGRDFLVPLSLAMSSVYYNMRRCLLATEHLPWDGRKKVTLFINLQARVLRTLVQLRIAILADGEVHDLLH